MKGRKESVVHSRKDTWPGMRPLAGSSAIKPCRPEGMRVRLWCTGKGPWLRSQDPKWRKASLVKRLNQLYHLHTIRGYLPTSEFNPNYNVPACLRRKTQGVSVRTRCRLHQEHPEAPSHLQQGWFEHETSGFSVLQSERWGEEEMPAPQHILARWFHPNRYKNLHLQHRSSAGLGLEKKTQIPVQDPPRLSRPPQ